MTSDSSSFATRVALVESFYDAVGNSDASALGALVDDHFSESASVEWPPSLPYGGRVEGAKRLRKLFVAMADSSSKLGPDAAQVVSITASGDTLVAELDFDWYPPGGSTGVPSGALELWRFDDDKVSSLRAFYWDTVALAAAMP